MDQIQNDLVARAWASRQRKNPYTDNANAMSKMINIQDNPWGSPIAAYMLGQSMKQGDEWEAQEQTRQDSAYRAYLTAEQGKEAAAQQKADLDVVYKLAGDTERLAGNHEQLNALVEATKQGIKSPGLQGLADSFKSVADVREGGYVMSLPDRKTYWMPKVEGAVRAIVNATEAVKNQDVHALTKFLLDDNATSADYNKYFTGYDDSGNITLDEDAIREAVTQRLMARTAGIREYKGPQEEMTGNVSRNGLFYDKFAKEIPEAYAKKQPPRVETFEVGANIEKRQWDENTGVWKTLTTAPRKMPGEGETDPNKALKSNLGVQQQAASLAKNAIMMKYGGLKIDPLTGDLINDGSVDQAVINQAYRNYFNYYLDRGVNPDTEPDAAAWAKINKLAEPARQRRVQALQGTSAIAPPVARPALSREEALAEARRRGLFLK